MRKESFEILKNGKSSNMYLLLKVRGKKILTGCMQIHLCCHEPEAEVLSGPGGIKEEGISAYESLCKTANWTRRLLLEKLAARWLELKIERKLHFRRIYMHGAWKYIILQVIWQGICAFFFSFIEGFGLSRWTMMLAHLVNAEGSA